MCLSPHLPPIGDFGGEAAVAHPLRVRCSPGADSKASVATSAVPRRQMIGLSNGATFGRLGGETATGWTFKVEKLLFVRPFLDFGRPPPGRRATQRRQVYAVA